jgi:sulfite oxidase
MSLAERKTAGTLVDYDGAGSDCKTGAQNTVPVGVQGYAYSGGGREVTRIDVSVDGGQTWDQAELVDGAAQKPDGSRSSQGGQTFPHGNKNWAWKRWRYQGQLPALPGGGCTTVVVKATDEAYNTQPESHTGIYNVRGNLATAWHRVRICPKCEAGKDGKALVWSTGETYGCGFNKEADPVAVADKPKKPSHPVVDNAVP